jgi:glycosyltransferase involved in cell wall biosynthesis
MSELKYIKGKEDVKILFLSNSVYAPSGYGVQSNGMLYDWLKHGYNVRQLAHYGLQGRMIGLNGLMIYPALEGDIHGNNTANLIFKNWKPDIFFTLYDIWMGAYVNKPSPDAPPETWQPIHPRWIPVIMVDHDPVPQATVHNAMNAYKPISPTKWGKEQLESQGIQTEYIPFGINTKIWRPVKGVEEKQELKRNLHKRSVPISDRRAVINEDTFLIHINGANKDPYRKAFMRAFIALQMFFMDNPDAESDVRIYIHTWMKFARDIPHGAKVLQVDWACKGASDYHMLCGVPEEEMAKIARSADLFIHPTQGGGFEIPVMEAMASGVPVAATDFVGLPELVGDGGWLIKKKTSYFSPLDSTQAIADEYDLKDIIEKAYNSSPDKLRKIGAKGRKHVEKNYDWKLVNPMYRCLIDEVIDEMKYKPLEERRV